MEAAAHSQNICHYAIITTDNREQANFRLNRNYDIGRRAKHNQPLFFWHLFYRITLCFINKCLFLPRLTCICRFMYRCNSNALRKMLCRFQACRSSRHPAIWFNSCIWGKSRQKTQKREGGFKKKKKKIWKVIGQTFCPSHLKRTNEIFFLSFKPVSNIVWLPVGQRGDNRCVSPPCGFSWCTAVFS